MEPRIYYLQNDYDGCSYYVYPDFKDDDRSIKYLFDFVHERPGSLVIAGNESQVHFDDGTAFTDESRKNPYFFFARTDSLSINCTGIRVSFDVGKVNFEIENSIHGKKLKADFEDIKINILQDMLDFAETDFTKFHVDNYIYELYNNANIKKVIIRYHEKGKWFDVEIL
jgi:hypothetical protein